MYNKSTFKLADPSAMAIKVLQYWSLICPEDDLFPLSSLQVDFVWQISATIATGCCHAEACKEGFALTTQDKMS